MDQTWQPYNLETFAGGVSSAVSPDLLPPNQTAWGMNVDFRGTKIHTRPNIHQRMYLPSGLVQGVGYFNIQGGMLVAMIAGVPYRLRIGIRNGDFSYEPIVLPFYNSPIIKQVWMCQTVESFLIQDGQSDAIIYDGSTARRADRLKTEVPIGLQMAYGNGRLWVAIQGNQLIAGDIRTADAGTELLFTENQYLSGGGALVFNDAITGLSFIPVTGTSDYGALVALGRNYVDTIRADITQRDSWASYPGFVTNAMRNVGTPSGRTIVQVNQDLMFRDALGGIRSLNTSLSNAYYAQYRGAQSDANVPISREVSRLVEFDSQQLLGFSSGVYFDNRLLMTSSPFLNTQGGVSHRDLVSLDFAPVSTMQGQSPPAYNGTWQGVDWTQLVKGEFNGQSRAFGISSDQDGFNRLWEFDTDQVDDVYISDGTSMTDGTALPVALSPIECFVEYPRIDFGEPKRRKRLTRCDVWLSNLTGQVDLTVYWRPDNNQKWTLWDETSHCAIMQDAATATPHVWKNLLPEQRPLVKSFSIPDTFDDVTTYALATGFGFQIRLAWTGSVKIERVAIWAQAVDSTDYVEREGQEPTCITNDVTGNELRYEILPSAGPGTILLDLTDSNLAASFAATPVPLGMNVYALMADNTAVKIVEYAPGDISGVKDLTQQLIAAQTAGTPQRVKGVTVTVVRSGTPNYEVGQDDAGSFIYATTLSDVSVGSPYQSTVSGVVGEFNAFTSAAITSNVDLNQCGFRMKPMGTPVISTLSTWYDASVLSGFVNGDPVLLMPDLSGHHHELTGTFAGAAPLYRPGIQNGRSGVQCYSPPGARTLAYQSDIVLQHIFVVAKVLASTFNGNGLVYGGNLAAGGWLRGGVGASTKFTPMATGAYFRNGVSISDWEALPGVCNIYEVTNSTQLTRSMFALFNDGFGDRTVDSYFFEALGYNGILSSADRLSVLAYLKTKWGIA